MWDYVIARAPTSLPKLNVKTQNEKNLEKLLRPVKEILLPSDSDSDCSSGIVDIFEEFHKDSFLRPLPGTKTKFLSKVEADWKTVERFTSDFKQTMKQLREDLNLGDALTTEDDKMIEQELTSNEKHIFFDKKIKVEMDEPINVEPEIVESDATSNSAVWNMIKAHQKPHFSTSPPQYDIYNLRPDHYLKRPHVAWEEVEDSRKKCEKWLNECETEY